MNREREKEMEENEEESYEEKALRSSALHEEKSFSMYVSQGVGSRAHISTIYSKKTD